jgi:hypothetical protein
MRAEEAIYHAKDGVTYRLTTTDDYHREISGLVVAEVHAPRIELIPGRVNFTLVDPAHNELMLGAIHADFEIEEVDGHFTEITQAMPTAELREGGSERIR